MGKVLQFTKRLTKEVIIPGKLYFDWDNPVKAIDDAVKLYMADEITHRVLLWARDEIAKRWEKINARTAEVK
jgi:hypothetical protein